MANSLAPGFIVFHYTANGHNHRCIFPVKPNVSGSSWSIDKVLGGVYDPWTTAIDAWNVLIKAILKTTDGIVSSDLYTQASETADPVYRESYASPVAGTSALAVLTASQVTVPFRTAAGGIMKLVLMETAGADYATIDRPPLSAGGMKNLSDFMIASTGFIFGRDGSRPIVATGVLYKMNDALRKKYLTAT